MAMILRQISERPPHWAYDCAIDLLLGTMPPRGCFYHLSEPEWEAMDTYIQDYLAADIICPSSSPARVAFFFVVKNDKSLHPCIDYRGLKEITIKNCYPLCSCHPLLSYSRRAFISKGDEWKTAFNMPTGHYKYLVMPFGLTNAPAVFQALVNDVLRDMINHFVYLDNILIYSQSLEEHIHHVCTVHQRQPVRKSQETELLNQDLKTGLLCAEDPLSWSSNLVWVKYAYNSLPFAATGLSPFQATYGYQLLLFSPQELKASVPSALTLIKPGRMV
ncbi:hypothetical protein QTP70_026549 [Hemibagrus guttatus]|uniref:ribonuclease H n=1 Tax=Hemibagrus guttatus TaxID=175788 RepID=A0AAE0RL16_9TELE|nr:hypothetical protein QTP70_026549 [Hemibagrus guttatus]